MLTNRQPLNRSWKMASGGKITRPVALLLQEKLQRESQLPGGDRRAHLAGGDRRKHLSQHRRSQLREAEKGTSVFFWPDREGLFFPHPKAPPLFAVGALSLPPRIAEAEIASVPKIYGGWLAVKNPSWAWEAIWYRKEGASGGRVGGGDTKFHSAGSFLMYLQSCEIASLASLVMGSHF